VAFGRPVILRMLLLFVVTPTNGPSLGARMSFLLLLGISQLAVVNSLGSVTLRTALAVGIFAYSAVIDIVVYRSSSVPGELFLVGVEQPCSTEKKKRLKTAIAVPLVYIIRKRVSI
jgi:hypothetical protein